MIPLRKFVIFLILFSVLPVTLVLIWVKLTVSSVEKAKKAEPTWQKVLSSTPIPSKNEVKQIILTIFAPVNGATVFEPTVNVKGMTASFAEVYVNAASSSADLEGNFSVEVPLIAGENPITILVRDGEGKFSQMEISVNYNTGQRVASPSGMN